MFFFNSRILIIRLRIILFLLHLHLLQVYHDLLQFLLLLEQLVLFKVHNLLHFQRVLVKLDLVCRHLLLKVLETSLVKVDFLQVVLTYLFQIILVQFLETQGEEITSVAVFHGQFYFIDEVDILIILVDHFVSQDDASCGLSYDGVLNVLGVHDFYKGTILHRLY